MLGCCFSFKEVHSTYLAYTQSADEATHHFSGIHEDKFRPNFESCWAKFRLYLANYVKEKLINVEPLRNYFRTVKMMFRPCLSILQEFLKNALVATVSIASDKFE